MKPPNSPTGVVLIFLDFLNLIIPPRENLNYVLETLGLFSRLQAASRSRVCREGTSLPGTGFSHVVGTAPRAHLRAVVRNLIQKQTADSILNRERHREGQHE